jgi:hypothetical protein
VVVVITNFLGEITSTLTKNANFLREAQLSRKLIAAPAAF